MRADNSTNVRTNQDRELKAPGWLRGGMRFLGSVAPPLAARAGEALFLLPPRHRAPQREQEALATGSELRVAFEGGSLRAWEWGSGPAVLLMHGWAGRGGQLAPFVEPLVAAGFRAVAFDGPGHGGSSGLLASVPHFAAALQAVADRVGGASAVIAHSMGAPATAVAVRHGLQLDAAVFVAPPRNPAGFFDGFQRALDLPGGVARGVRQRLERRFGAGLEEFDVARMAPDAAPALLVIHDEGDLEVPWSDGATIAGARPAGRLRTTQGLGHRRILRDPGVVSAAAAFVRGAARRCHGCERPARASYCPQCEVSIELFDVDARLAA
jgi:pimeloyl-ACP methyl ester carboxylesterase